MLQNILQKYVASTSALQLKMQVSTISYPLAEIRKTETFFIGNGEKKSHVSNQHGSKQEYRR